MPSRTAGSPLATRAHQVSVSRTAAKPVCWTTVNTRWMSSSLARPASLAQDSAPVACGLAPATPGMRRGGSGPGGAWWYRPAARTVKRNPSNNRCPPIPVTTGLAGLLDLVRGCLDQPHSLDSLAARH